MRREVEVSAPLERPIRLVEFVKAFNIGGTEVQVVELLRGLPSRYQLNVGVLDETGPLLESVWKLGHLPASFPLSGSYARPQTALAIAKTAHWLMKNRVELVHAHDLYGALVAAPAAKLARCKLIVGRLDLAHFHTKSQRFLLSRFTAMADHVVANAKAIKDMLINEEGIPASKISVIHNGLDLRRFDERVREGLKAELPDTLGEPVVVHVANMNHEVKRQEDVLEAIRILGSKGRRLHVYFVGDGPRRREIEAKAALLNVADRAHFLRHRLDVPAVYQRATFGVLCSSAEGLSNAVMEGMAAGLPMVVSRVGGNPDLIEDGVRGYVVERHKPEQLAAAFERVLDNPEKAKQMGRAARAFVEKELTLEKLCAEHDRMYRSVVGA